MSLKRPGSGWTSVPCKPHYPPPPFSSSTSLLLCLAFLSAIMDGPSDAAASQSAPFKLSPSLHAELSAILRGDVYLRDDPKYVFVYWGQCSAWNVPSFLDYAKMFNGDVKVAALAVACPLDAQDVSQ
jgi:hypothetical protein